jgi:uncharacterized protein (DUF488 family)
MIYTVGHSVMSKNEFLSLIRKYNIETVIDVRSHPSSKWVQFRQDELKIWLPDSGIKYEWWPNLGGWSEKYASSIGEMSNKINISPYIKGKFPKQRISGKLTYNDNKPHWTSTGLYDYQWFMSLSDFMNDIDLLVKKFKYSNISIMCAEVLPWKCHRSMISDYLLWIGIDSMHIQPKPKMHSNIIGNRLERYEPEVISIWEKKHKDALDIGSSS